MVAKYQSVDGYIEGCSDSVVPLMRKLHAFIHEQLPNATEELQYGVPAFLISHGAPVVYLYGSKKHANFGFLRSAKLTDPDGVLQGSGNPSKHIKLKPDQSVDFGVLTEFVAQCRDIRSCGRCAQNAFATGLTRRLPPRGSQHRERSWRGSKLKPYVTSCHCGAARIEMTRPIRQLTRCNCSICRRYGAVWVYQQRKAIRIIAAKDALRSYSWGDETLGYFFSAQTAVASRTTITPNAATTGLT